MRTQRKFLSILLALSMLLSLLPVTALADGEESSSSSSGVYEMNGNVYETWPDTLVVPTTVKLLQNATADITIKEGDNVTLDLNGHKLTNTSGDTITVASGASLTITGSGTVDNVTHAKAAIYNNGTVTLNGGNYTRSQENGISSTDNGGNSFYVLLNHGTMTIEAGVTVTQNGHYSSMIENGYQNYTSGSARTGYVEGTNQAAPVLTINGGTFSGGLNTVKNDDNGTLTINGGTFTNVSQAALLNWNVAEVNGGDFSVTDSASAVILNGGGNNTINKGDLTITDGSFTAAEGVAPLGAMNSNTSYMTGVKVEGGSYSASVIDYVTEDIQYEVSNDGTYTYHETLAKALEAAAEDSSAEITAVGVENAATVTATVTLDYGYDGKQQTIKVAVDDSITLPALTREGYEFINWQVSETETYQPGEVARITSDTTFTAQWGETLTEEVEVVSGEHEIDSELPADATEAEESVITDTATQVQNLTQEGLEAVIENQSGEIAEAAKAVDGYEKFVTEAGGNTVTIVIESSLDIKVKDATVADTSTSVTVEITPKYVVKATTAASVAAMNNDNTVTLLEKQELTVGDEAVKISIPLPEALQSFEKITVKHTAKTGVFYYDAEIAGQVLSFVNPDGFSDFELIGLAETVKVNATGPNGSGEVTYTTDTIGQELTVSLTSGENVPAGKSWRFNGWNITAVKDGEETITIATAMKELTLEAYTEMVRLSAEGYTIEADAVQPGLYTSNGGGGGSASYTVSAPSSVSNGAVSVSPKNASKGTTVTVTVKPDAGYELDTLTVRDADGNKLALTKKSDTQYTFVMPASKVTVAASFTEIVEVKPTAPTNPFTDVKSGDWYSAAAQYVYEKGLMAGVSATQFGGNITTTRGMIATMLYSLAGKPRTGTAAFPDVSAGQYYAGPVAWASANGVVAGYGDGSFGPNDTITREQLALMLYNYAALKGYDTSASASLTRFVDGEVTSGWAVHAMEWAVGAGLLSGKDGGRLDPIGSATRAEVAQILMNFCENIVE